MPENRDQRVLVHLEETFFALLKDVAKDIPISGYVRSLIINDLVAKGKLDEKTIKRILVG